MTFYILCIYLDILGFLLKIVNKIFTEIYHKFSLKENPLEISIVEIIKLHSLPQYTKPRN